MEEVRRWMNWMGWKKDCEETKKKLCAELKRREREKEVRDRCE